MSKNNGTIAVQEKRELAKLVTAEFDQIIKQVEEELKFTETGLLEEARNKFGIKAINKQIKQLKEQISMLEKKKQEMGFDSCDELRKTHNYSTGQQEYDRNTKLGRFYCMKIARTADVQALKDQRNNRLKDIWLEDKRAEVKTLINVKPDVKFLTHKK